MPRPVFNLLHRINSIANEIHDHLLYLYPVTVDRQETFKQFLLHDHPIPPQFARHECNHLTRCLIYIDEFGYSSLSLKERPQAHDDIGGPISVSNRAESRIARTFDIRWIVVQHLQACLRIRNNACERLVYFMRNRSCQNAQTHDSGYVSKFGS